MINGGAGVKVGSRVSDGCILKAAASVGLIVAVANGVWVGGGSTIGKNPGDNSTLGAYIQPTPFGQSLYTMRIHSCAGEVPNAGAVAPKGSEPQGVG